MPNPTPVRSWVTLKRTIIYLLYRVKINQIKMIQNRGYYIPDHELRMVGQQRLPTGEVKLLPENTKEYTVEQFFEDYVKPIQNPKRKQKKTKNDTKKMAKGVIIHTNYRKYYEDEQGVDPNQLFEEIKFQDIRDIPVKNDNRYVVRVRREDNTFEEVQRQYFESYNYGEEMYVLPPHQRGWSYFSILTVRFFPIRIEKEKYQFENNKSIKDLNGTLSKNGNIISYINKLFIAHMGHTSNAAPSIRREALLQFYTYNYLIINIIDHVLVPTHRLMSEQERKELFLVYGQKNLPTLYVTDAIARYYNAKAGDVFEILRDELTFTGPVGKYKFFRLVVPDLLVKN